MKTQTIFILIAGFIIIGGATFLTLNKKTEAPTTNNGIEVQSNQTNTYKNSYNTDGGENENKAGKDNSTTQNPVAQTPVKTPSTTTSYTLAQVATHNSQSDCWTVVNGSVYDITSYITRHPGGVRAISAICGKDGTSTFEGQHGGQSRPENTLSSFLIGSLK